MKNTVYLVVLILIIVLIGGIIYISRQKQVAPAATISPTPAAISDSTIDNSDLKQGGSSLLDPKGAFTVLYPSDWKSDVSDEAHPRIYKTGPTQTGQTEMYDGALVVFETINLGNDSLLSQWVDNNIKTTTADGTLKVIEPKKQITINNYPGFTYKTQGLGEATYYVLQKDMDSKIGIVITTSVSDPKNVGFQKEVDKILSTLDIQK